jgi:hypothetical protein
MQSRDLDTQQAPNRWWAARDARMRSIAMASTWSQTKLIQAESIRQVIPLVYTCRDVYVNPRQKFITIKVENARVKDRQNLDLLEQEWEAKGIKKCESAQGVIYRVPR